MSLAAHVRCAVYTVIALVAVFTHRDAAIIMGCIILARIEVLAGSKGR